MASLHCSLHPSWALTSTHLHASSPPSRCLRVSIPSFRRSVRVEAVATGDPWDGNPELRNAKTQQLQSGRIVLIVNPKGGNGATFRQWEAMREQVLFGLQFRFQVDEVLTEYPFHAAELARQAAANGAVAVVAVGGDGTLHEAANGLFQASRKDSLDTHKDQLSSKAAASSRHKTALGAIPLGTGCDFARSLGWKANHVQSSIDRLLTGQLREVSVGLVQLPLYNEERIFINVASVHLSARVCQASTQFKMLGPLCYALAVVTEFPKHRNQDLLLRVDGGALEEAPQVTAMALGNGRYFGGGMCITPLADPSSPELQMVTLSGFHLQDFLFNGSKLFQGTHLSTPGVSSRKITSIEIGDPRSKAGSDGIPAVLSDVKVEVDGEFLGTLPATFSLVPRALSLLA